MSTHKRKANDPTDDPKKSKDHDDTEDDPQFLQDLKAVTKPTSALQNQMEKKEKTPQPEEEKTKTSTTEKPALKKNSEGDYEYTLSGNKKLKVKNFKGKWYVDIREYWTNDGKLLPTKKGVSLNYANWKEFKSMIDSIDETLKMVNGDK